MDVLKAIQEYVDRMVTQTTGIKVLLLDSETTPIISLASTQSTLLSHEVYLTDRIDNPKRERMPHLKCVAFLRPTRSSLEAVERELREPKYGEYWLYFSNVLKKSAIERLAEADEHEVVRELQEHFADYSPITTHHFTLNLSLSPLPSLPSSIPPSRLYGDTPNTWDLSPDTGTLERHVEGLTALLLSLKKKPVIRYERMSSMAKKLGSEVLYQMNAEPSLFDFRPSAVPPLLIILDRRNDPVTPLLTQWTYEAQVHELIGITNGRVDLSGAPDIRDDLKEITLSPEQDPFFAANLHTNFGDLGANIKAYVADYQNRSSQTSAKNIETIADMKRFVEQYPEFRKLGVNVSKHVALMGELSRLVTERRLLEVSELEQSLASTESHATDLRSVQSLIASDTISPDAKLRLAILYALRYQKYAGNQIAQMVGTLPQNGVSESDALLVNIMLNFAGADQRQDDLFANENLFSRGKSVLKGFKGVENVYTQHSPHLAQTVDNLLKGRLKETSYPFLEGQPVISRERPQDIILFIVGGTTYEEARTVSLLNQQFASGTAFGATSGPGSSSTSSAVSSGTRILLGGTCVHNSTSFLDMVREGAKNFPGFTSSALALKPTSFPTATAGTTTGGGGGSGGGGGQPGQVPAPGGINLQLGNVSLSVGGAGGSALEAGVDGVRDVARNIFGRVRDRING